MKSILFILPDHFSVRNFIYSPFLSKDFKGAGIRIIFAVRDPENHRAAVAGRDDVILESLENMSPKADRWRRRFVNFLYHTLEYRFNRRCGFQHIKVKEQIPSQYIIHKPEDSFKYYIKYPAPHSRLVYRLYYWLYNAPVCLDRRARELMDEYSPTLVVTANPQIPHSRSFVLLAKQRKIKTIAYVNSWDYLTTDGPVLRDIDEFVVWYERGRQELKKWHQVTKPIHNIGPIHLDVSFRSDTVISKDEICRHFGLDPGRPFIVFGVYNQRLGAHEPGIARYVAEKVIPRLNANLIIRGHPYDENFYQRYGELGRLPNVVLNKGKRFNEEKAGELHDQTILYSILKHSQMVICSATTLTLDAIRFDKPVINLGFDGETHVPPVASVARRYTYDHYSPLLAADGIYFVQSYEALRQAIEEAMAKPQLKLAGQHKIKTDYLEPLDGRASDRFFDLLAGT